MLNLNEMWSRPVVIYSGFADNQPEVPALEDEDLVALLTAFDDPGCSVESCAGRDCTAKRTAPCWSPASYPPGATRGNKNVLSINYAVFDLDHLRPGQLAEVRARFEEYEHVVHSTHSHAEGDECYRLIFPLTRSVAPAEWPAVHDGVIRALQLPADPCGDLARLYALPTCRAGAPKFAEHRRGKPLDVDDALAVAGLRGEAPKAATPIEPLSLDELRARLAVARRSKASARSDRAQAQALILGRILDGESLAEPGARDKTLLSATGLLAFWLPSDTPWAAALEILRPSLSKMDLEPEGFDVWAEVARGQYERGQRNRIAQDVRREKERERFVELAERVKSKGVITAAEAGDAWSEMLIQTKAGPKSCEHNARLLLACHPDLKGTIRWDTMSLKVVAVGGPLAGIGEDVLDFAAAAWLQQNAAFQGGAHVIRPALLQVARESPWDPLAEYLGELAWDGGRRLDSFFERYLGATVEEGDAARYVRAVSRRFLIALVARALRPGCKADAVLVLEGPQGAGKSSALEALVGRRYFLDTALELGSRDFLQAIAGAWLVELGELAALRRSELERVKQTVSSRSDKFRLPYGRETVEFPRRCVFAGTTNEGDYLKDLSGNRRFWPVRVGNVDVDAIERDRDLILAEAVSAFQEGERWWLTDDEGDLAAREAEERLPESLIQSSIERWWWGLDRNRRPRVFEVADVIEMSLRMTPDRVTHALRCEVGWALRRLGFRRVRRRSPGGPQKFAYEASEEMMAAPKQTTAARAAGMALVQAMKEKSE